MKVFTVERGQIVYPGDLLGIAGTTIPLHVHVDYTDVIPYALGLLPNKPADGLLEGINIFDPNHQVTLDELKTAYQQMDPHTYSIISPFGYPDNSPKVDFFRYLPDWTFPEITGFQPGEGCVDTHEDKYCVFFYRGIGATPDLLLVPSGGLFAAGNELVPPEIDAIK